MVGFAQSGSISSAVDAVVVGGGITGAGVLRDFARRGVSALLVERGGLGAATTAASSRLIHGGLRYLLYDRPTTITTCWDAGHIARIAGSLLTRLPILWPVYRRHRRGMEVVETLLEVYDRFQPWKGGRPHLRLTAEETHRLVPGLRTEGLVGGLIFDEYEVDPVALVKANIDDAVRVGAQVHLQTEVLSIRPADEGILVRLSTPEGGENALKARVVVNAGGPWAGEVARRASTEVALQWRKGSHLLFGDGWKPMEGTPLSVGLLLEAEDRERYIFVIPEGKGYRVGPTDEPCLSVNEPLRTEEKEIRFLLSSLEPYFNDSVGRFDGVIVGARPILGSGGSEKRLSRGFRVFDHGKTGGPARLITVAGGKMSDFRLMAEETVNAALGYLGGGRLSTTARVTLQGHAFNGIPSMRPPRMGGRKFWEDHPRWRQAHAWAHLAWAYARHQTRRLWAAPRWTSADDVGFHYKGSHHE